MQSSCTTRHQSLCPNPRPTAGSCHRGPHQLAALPWKMTPTPWRACPPCGWAGVASAGQVGPSPHDWTLHQSSRVCQRRDLCQIGCSRFESGPNPHHHRNLPGHCLGLQYHLCEPQHTHLHEGHPPLCGRAQICCWIPGHH